MFQYYFKTFLCQAPCHVSDAWFLVVLSGYTIWHQKICGFLKRGWTMCSKYKNMFEVQKSTRVEHLMSMGIFDLIRNHIVVQVLRSMRQMTMETIMTW